MDKIDVGEKLEVLKGHNSPSWRPLGSAQSDQPANRIGSSLGRVVTQAGLPEIRVLQVIFDGWDQLVGEAIAAHARPVRIAGAELVIEVDHPAWTSELRSLQSRLLSLLASSCGQSAPQTLRFVTTPTPGGQGTKGRVNSPESSSKPL